mmetsp:Transcript_44730/g.103450  ORF Transcript_44730/g.103450 Transcript_44730/m.103450 type:complete len:590 (-) Transcript_44730:90-1859(-)
MAMHFFVPSGADRSKEEPLLERELAGIDGEDTHRPRESAFLKPDVQVINGHSNLHFSRSLTPPQPQLTFSRMLSPSAHEYLLGGEDLPEIRHLDARTHLQRRNSPTQAQIAGSVEELRRFSEEGKLERQALKSQSWLQDISLSAFSVFMSCTDAVAMGACLFPPAWNGRALGMRLGLVSMAVSNIVIAMTSEAPHNVGGLCDTIIPTLRGFFLAIQGNCTQSCLATAMVALPIVTLVTGLATFAAGFSRVGNIVEACPDVVFNGFIAGTGAQLLEFGLNMMLSSFDSLLSEDSWRELMTTDGLAHCGPGMASAIFVFLLPRYYPKVDTFLLPVTVVVMLVLFYFGVLVSSCSLEDVRLHGWLFEVEVPKRIEFYKVWTDQRLSAVRWEDLFTFRFLQTTLQVLAVAFLTTVKNIYGTREVTKVHVDIDAEIRSTGLVNLACGLVGGLPSSQVMSFSVTAHSLGASSKRFSWVLATMSIFLMVTGDFLVSILPKMVPACVVLWIGLVLLIFYAWDPLGEISTVDHTIIVVMILSDLLWGCGPMVLIGLTLTMLSRGAERLWQGIPPTLSRWRTPSPLDSGGEYEMNKFVI